MKIRYINKIPNLTILNQIDEFFSINNQFQKEENQPMSSHDMQI